MQPTEKILSIFEHIAAIPRGSGNEAGVRTWLQAWAEERHYHARVDAKGNLAVYVPPSPGWESKPTVILQGHMDMVCQKTVASNHDFTRDPIRTWRDGDWLRARGTTLGADNGIGVALALALAEDLGVAHPRLELLFTVEEEVGLAGADQLDPALLTGKILVNLDSEKEGVFTIGCAGGGMVTLVQPAHWEPAAPGAAWFELKVSGLKGGHSGEDIHRHRGNANKLLARALEALRREGEFKLAAWAGGTARNAIPASARAVFAANPEAQAGFERAVQAFQGTLQTEFARSDAGVNLGLRQAADSRSLELQPPLPGQVCSQETTAQMLSLMLALPNGVAEFSAEVEGAVETSNNLGVVELRQDGLAITSFQRSAVYSRLGELVQRVEAVGRLAGAQVSTSSLMPPWRPDRSSPLLQKCLQVYERLFGKPAGIEVSHGGLEVGRLSERCGGLDGISLGPVLMDLHSPDERLYIPSLERVWALLVELLKS